MVVEVMEVTHKNRNSSRESGFLIPTYPVMCTLVNAMKNSKKANCTKSHAPSATNIWLLCAIFCQSLRPSFLLCLISVFETDLGRAKIGTMLLLKTQNTQNPKRTWRIIFCWLWHMQNWRTINNLFYSEKPLWCRWGLWIMSGVHVINMSFLHTQWAHVDLH